MNKKWLFITILVITILTIIFILLFTSKKNYNQFIIGKDKWNNIVSNRKSSTSISIENIQFNDYNLIIDEKNSVIYYSVVNTTNKYNPSVSYNLSGDKLKIAFNKDLNHEILENTDDLKIIIYNDKEYRIYTLVATNYPILNITYKDEETNKRKIDVDIYIFDNHVEATNRVFRSDGKLKIIEENKEYGFSLKKESLGHNERENYMSIFGMEKQNEYLVKVASITNNKDKYVQLFINNKYKGIYMLGHNDERRIDNFERNKENNR